MIADEPRSRFRRRFIIAVVLMIIIGIIYILLPVAIVFGENTKNISAKIDLPKPFGIGDKKTQIIFKYAEVKQIEQKVDKVENIVVRYTQRDTIPREAPENGDFLVRKETIKKYCDAVGVDWKLVEAIGRHESASFTKCPGGCSNTHNYFGRKGGSGWMVWNSFDEAMENQCNYIFSRWYDRGMTTPRQINAGGYATNPSWYVAIEKYMNSLEN